MTKTYRKISQSSPTVQNSVIYFFIFLNFLYSIKLFSQEFIGSSLLQVNYQKLVSRADLFYDKPAPLSEEGMPVGNGRMGSLVWTTPTSLKFQINRVDVFANNSASNSFFQRHTDYCGGCAFVDITLVDYGKEIFTEENTVQHLSCYDGLVSLTGDGIKAQVLVWHERDVMAIQIDDQRKVPTTIRTCLRMLRSPVVKTGGHIATSFIEILQNKIILWQEFTEDEYHCRSAVVIEVVGRDTNARLSNDTEAQLSVNGGKGKFTIYIASAASFDGKEDVVSSAVDQLNLAISHGFNPLFESNKNWWHNFWQQAFIYLHSSDDEADFIERNYTYFLYVMGSSSRGKLPPKFNGMLWISGGDARKWGSLFWGANQSCLYNGLFPANRLELIKPFFKMYNRMFAACELAARQQWGSRGVYIPETVPFDGPEQMPETVANEMRELYLVRKQWKTRSEMFKNYSATKLPFYSRFNWKANGKWVNGFWTFPDKGAGPFGQVTHIFSRSAKIAYKYWLYYEYTGDLVWLRDTAYPILKGVAEFYRNFPNLKKGIDGRYHLYHVNDNEAVRDCQDTVEEISALRGILPVTIRASEILEIDTDLRLLWNELLGNLVLLPQLHNLPDRSTVSEPNIWIKSLFPAAQGNPHRNPDPNTMPVWYFDLGNLETEDPEVLEIANNTFDSYFPEGINKDTPVYVLSKLPVVGAILGRSEAAKYLIPNQIRTAESPVLLNRMTLREGYQTTGVQRLGRMTDALHLALCQSVPSTPGQSTVIRLFPAWPREWDAAFTLLARGGFLVSSSMEKRQIEFVEIHSQWGNRCCIRNPWQGKVLSIYRNNQNVGDVSGGLLKFDTNPGETIILLPTSQNPTKKSIL